MVAVRAWIQSSNIPVGQDRDGYDLYGHVAILVQDEQEEAELIEFLRQHDVHVYDGWVGGWCGDDQA